MATPKTATPILDAMARTFPTPLNRKTNKELIALSENPNALDADALQALSDELLKRAANARRKADELQTVADAMAARARAGNGKAKKAKK